MRALIASLVLVLATTGCGRWWQTRPAIPAQCDPLCFVPCKSTARWEADPDSAEAWDALAGETLPASRDETRTCEVRRKACEQCLQRLHKAKVIDLGR